MSDLIKEARVEAKALATSGVKGAGNMINALADEVEAKDAEIERLKESLEIEQDAYDILAKDHAKLQAEIAKIECPDNVKGVHRWNGDGQCLDCCNYATDLIDAVLNGEKPQAEDCRYRLLHGSTRAHEAHRLYR